MPSRAQFYRDTSILYQSRAQSYLAQNDLLQASEKGWGAAALRIKNVAERRRWRHTSHDDLRVVINRLVAQTGDTRLKTFFESAGALHHNFYEGRMTRRRVRNQLRQVGELLRRLDRL